MVPIVLFTIAAFGGIVLAIIRFSGREVLPLWLAIVHGIVGAAGLVALIVAVTSARLSATTSLVLFIVAALGGVVLFASQLRNKAIPIAVMVVHALVAILAFVLLLVAYV